MLQTERFFFYVTVVKAAIIAAYVSKGARGKGGEGNRVGGDGHALAARTEPAIPIP